ncbi:Arginine exporter protein ArgO [bioreactor metagenome]|uniref:Arginine exporter protein ArgO n=1 Tax=bioreactor metagenome TaxID=1076179 RepID=A0A645IVL6_9ZZZZ
MRACVIWCVLCDAILVAVGVAGMAAILGSSPTLARYLTLGAVLFLVGYGLFAWHRAFFAPDNTLDAATGKAERSLLGVLSALAVITLANPHVYLDTVVLIGSIGAQHDGWYKWYFVIGAACASLTWFVVLAFAGRKLQRVFANPMAWRVLDTLTGAMMFVLAWWVWQGS